MNNTLSTDLSNDAATDPNSVGRGIGPVCITYTAGYVKPVKRARRTKAEMQAAA